ncbi:rod shape-determining protein RodA [Candidatus Sumerlaeota bacterium]|nr:rod shape-determining protein RodA [Candidatus Sumerlaeota bacterium]
MALLQFERRVFRHLHWGILGCMVALTLIGIAAIAGSEMPGEPHAPKQAVWLALGIVVFLLAVAINPPWMRWLVPFAYVGLLIALLLLPVFGRSIKGAESWYPIGPLRFQPSELIKVALVLLLADLAARRPGRWRSLPQLAVPIFLTAVPMALIASQPDLGTAAVLIPMLGVMLFMGGARIRHLLLLAVLALSCIALAWPHLKPYQRERIWTFLNPAADIQGAGYQMHQVRISLGSGQLWGRLGQEDEDDDEAPETEYSRAELDLLPEAHTDFIFPSLSEQFGFIGCTLVIALYALLTVFAAAVAFQARTYHGGLMTVGLLTILLTHVVLNIGMCLSLLPVTGLPLPFLSYGGTSMLTNFLIGGLIANVAARRYELEPSRV